MRSREGGYVLCPADLNGRGDRLGRQVLEDPGARPLRPPQDPGMVPHPILPPPPPLRAGSGMAVARRQPKALFGAMGEGKSGPGGETTRLEGPPVPQEPGVPSPRPEPPPRRDRPPPDPLRASGERGLPC